MLSPVQWATIGLSVTLVLVALTSTTLEWTQLLQGRRGFSVPDATHCDDGRVCTASLYNPATLTCQHRPYPRTRACQDSCHVEDALRTRCDAEGGCASTDPTECLGYCPNADDPAGDCGTVLPLDWDYWSATELTSATYTCEFQACGLSVLGTSAHENCGIPVADASGARNCLDYLNTTRLGAAVACITTERFTLDAALSATFQPFLCTYRYACSTKNYSMIRDYVDHGTPLY